MKRNLAIILVSMLILALTAGCSTGGNTVQQDARPTPTLTPQEQDTTNTPQEPTPSDSENSPVYPMEITDSRGNITHVEKEPEKVISLSPNITEIIYALGKGDKLIGRTAFCNYPEEAQNAAVVGDFIEWNFETIVALEPDVVFASSLNTEENEKKLKDLGINIVFLTQTESFESTYETIGMMGEVLNAQEKAKEITEAMQKTVDEVQNAVKGQEKPSVYYVVGYGEYGDYTATGETFIASMLEMAGGDNIAADMTGWVYSLEKLMEKDPYIILCPEEAKAFFEQTIGYKELSAVQEGRIYAIDADLLELQGPRLSQGLMQIAKILHPESIK